MRFRPMPAPRMQQQTPAAISAWGMAAGNIMISDEHQERTTMNGDLFDRWRQPDDAIFSAQHGRVGDEHR